MQSRAAAPCRARIRPLRGPRPARAPQSASSAVGTAGGVGQSVAAGGEDQVLARGEGRVEQRRVADVADAPAGRAPVAVIAADSAAFPPLGRARPAISRSSVDLPAPFGPTTARLVPSGMAKSTPRNATARPKRFSRLRCGDCRISQPARAPSHHLSRCRLFAPHCGQKRASGGDAARRNRRTRPPASALGRRRCRGCGSLGAQQLAGPPAQFVRASRAVVFVRDLAGVEVVFEVANRRVERSPLRRRRRGIWRGRRVRPARPA